MSNTDHWMPLYIGDYMAATMQLTTLEHGAYLLLLMYYWQSGPLPDDDHSLAAIAKMEPRAWKKIALRIRKFFTSIDGALHQKRADKERSRVSEVSSKRREAGLAGAGAKWGQSFNGRPQAKMEPKPPDDPDGNCHPFAMPLPPDLPSACQPFATAHSDSDLESKQAKEEERSSLPLAAVPAGAGARPAPSGADIWAGEEADEADDGTPSHAEILARRQRFHDELASAERTPALLDRMAKSFASSATRAEGVKPYRSTQEQLNAIQPQPRATPRYLTPEQLAAARTRARRVFA